MSNQEQEVTTKPKRLNFWDRFTGKAIVVQTKGKVIMTGKLLASAHGFIILENPIIKGWRVQAKPSQVFIDRAQIAHFHEQCEIEVIEGKAE